MKTLNKIKENKSYQIEFLRLHELFEEDTFETSYMNDGFTIKEKINNEIFKNWIYRNTYIDLNELEEDLDLYYDDSLRIKCETISFEKLLNYCELILNLCLPEHYSDNCYFLYKKEYEDQIICIINQINCILEKYNYTKEEIDNYYYIMPKNNELEILKESDNILTTNVFEELIKYQSLKNKNNVIEKQKILCFLDSKRQEIMENQKYKSWEITKQISKDIGEIMNNCNIRHANTRQGTNVLPDEEKIKFYDLAYRKLLRFFILIESKNDDDEMIMNEVKQIASNKTSK